MFKDMNKMEIAGLAVAGLGTIAGIGIAVYTKIKTGKESKEIENIGETIENSAKELNELLKQTGTIDTILDKIDQAYENGEFDQMHD